jgi:Transposase DDE domain
MRFARVCYQITSMLRAAFPHLRPAEVTGLSLWLLGTLRAHSGCQTQVVAALARTKRSRAALRERLRSWLYDGEDRAAPCHTRLEVTACFPCLLGWIIRLWQGRELALAVDITYQRSRLTVLVVCVLYRGVGIPVAWVILPGPGTGRWVEELCGLLTRLAPAVPSAWLVVVLADRGLRSPQLYRHIQQLGWHPMIRLEAADTFRPAGWHRRYRTDWFVREEGMAWISRGAAFAERPLSGTLVVVWFAGEAAPCAVLTDLAPETVGLAWYGLRMWVELTFRALKRLGWQWQRTRRTDPDRVARHWLVLALAQLMVLVYGTRIEDADRLGRPPQSLHHPPPPAPPRVVSLALARTVSLITVGWDTLRDHLAIGRLWRLGYLLPDPWPLPPPDLTVRIHSPP